MNIKELAVYCGVSVSTVSRVLNDHPDVSEPVRKKVQEAARRFHYVPNNSARDLVRPKSDAVGLIVRGAGNPFFTSLINTIEKDLSTEGYSMVLHQIKSEDDELAAAASLIRSKRLLGVILLGGRFDYTPEEIASLEVPFVCCTFTNSFGTLEKKNYASVSIDDEKEAYRAVKYLTDLGHRKIAVLLDSKQDHSISELRYNGYKRALSEAGIEADEDLAAECIEYEMGSAYREMKRLLERRPDVTAVFAIADSLAIAALKAIAEDGRKIPEDCSLIAIDGIEMSKYTVPTLTTLVQPNEEIGKRAVRILTEIIGGKTGERHVNLSTVLREGGTVGPALSVSRPLSD